jgi:hypothetical protein
MLQPKLIPILLMIVAAVGVGSANTDNPPPCSEPDDSAIDILEDYRWTDTTTDTATVSWRQRASLPTVAVSQIVLVADTAVCRRAVNAYNTILANQRNDPRVSLQATVVKWGTTRYAISDSTHNQGEWTLHVVTDSSFTQTLAITRQ